MADTEYNAELISGIQAFDTKNFALAYQLLAPFVTSGSPEALFRIGMMQMNGLGMVANQTLGFKNLKLATEAGHSISHHILAVSYLEGEGVEKDIQKAIMYFEKAAEFNLVGAMFVLAGLYEDGKQVPKNLEKAQYWNKKASMYDE